MSILYDHKIRTFLSDFWGKYPILNRPKTEWDSLRVKTLS